MVSAPEFELSAIPDLSGRVIIVTGGNTGLGKESIAALCKAGGKVYMGSRTESKALAAIDDIKKTLPNADLHYIQLDLISFSSISAFAKSFLEKESRLDILMNNAGVMAMPYSRTEDGYEIQFGTNHMGHYLLTKLLLPAIPAGGRIVNLSSLGHNAASSGINISAADHAKQVDQLAAQLESSSTWTRYGISKLANILHAKELARRYPQIISVSCHPGVIISDLYKTFVGDSRIMGLGVSAIKCFATPVEKGALNQLFCATMPVENGGYYVPVGRLAEKAWWHEKPSRFAKDDKLAEKLWEWSEEEVKKHGF
ncbi:hypothetical protein BZA77DRAFT_385614 [Pyronema omphalodes]|nr:hypothetical protein BZA77DRAFT_385614 [Pyronema omphalodes]